MLHAQYMHWRPFGGLGMSTQDRSAQPGAWLVLQLQRLVDAGFKMATGHVEALRPLGLHLLKVSNTVAWIFESDCLSW